MHVSAPQYDKDIQKSLHNTEYFVSALVCYFSIHLLLLNLETLKEKKGNYL